MSTISLRRCAVVGLSADEPEILPSSTHPICLRSADGGQVRSYPLRVPLREMDFNSHRQRFYERRICDTKPISPYFASRAVAVGSTTEGPSHAPVAGSGSPGPITRSFESTCAIVAARSAVAGVPQWLRAYTAHALARFCCHVERPIPQRRHASDNVSFRPPPETCMVCPSVFWPRSAGSTASDRYYADDCPSSFCLRRIGARTAPVRQ